MKIRYIAVLALMIVTLFGCSAQQPATGNQSQQPAPQTGGLGIKQDVAISGFKFDPQNVTVPLQATVIWTNNDNVPHTVVTDTGGMIESGTINPGETYAHTFITAGTYEYHCGVHPSMKGKVTVQ
jgi:plastocyanin